MDWTGIILRLLAWLRPLLWYEHAFCRLVNVILCMWEDEPSQRWFVENASGRADLEQKIADAEQCLNIIISLRARELLGLSPEPEDRPGLRSRGARIHVAPPMERLGARLARLAERYQDFERLARLRAERIRRKQASAPVELGADHRPKAGQPLAPPSLGFSAIVRRSAHLWTLGIPAPP